MIEIICKDDARERLNGVKKSKVQKGKTIETSFGEELITRKDKETVSIDKEIKIDTLMETTIGNKKGIIETQYNMLSKDKGGWASGYILMHAYFPGDKKYSELNEMMETNRK